MRPRLILGVSAAWTLIGVLWGAQSTMGSSLQGADPIPLARALNSALVQTLPWIPVTLAVIVLAVRFPITRARWTRRTLIHLAAATVLAFVANVLIVLGFWASAGTYRGLGTLARSGALWATVNFHFALLVYAAILSITQGVLYYRRTRARELQLAKVEGQLARAHLQALNAQIRPHFLFNTLHTIGQLWRSGRNDDADAVLDHLGSLFHKVERSTSRLEVPLAEELELVRDYLTIEQVRFRDRLHTTVQAPDEALDYLVPPLILQPLVENAIRHGISSVSSSGTVDVTATLDSDHLRITVRDDGPGTQSTASQPGAGTGLRNTRERLAQLYGPGDHLRVEDAPAGGTIVCVDIPLKGPRRTTR